MTQKVLVTRVPAPRIIRYRSEPDSTDWCFYSMCVCLTVVILFLVIPITVTQVRFCNRKVRYLCLSPNNNKPFVSLNCTSCQQNTEPTVDGQFARRSMLPKWKRNKLIKAAKSSNFMYQPNTTTSEVYKCKHTTDENVLGATKDVWSYHAHAEKDNCFNDEMNVTRILRKRILQVTSTDVISVETSSETETSEKSGGVTARGVNDRQEPELESTNVVEENSEEMNTYSVVTDDQGAYIALVDVANMYTGEECGGGTTTMCPSSEEPKCPKGTKSVVWKNKCPCNKKKSTCCKCRTPDRCKCGTPDGCKCATSEPCKCRTTEPCKCGTPDRCKCATLEPCKCATWEPCKCRTSKPCKCRTPDPCKSTTRRCKTKMCTVIVECPKTKRTTVYDCEAEEPWSFPVAKEKVTGGGCRCNKPCCSTRDYTKRKPNEKFPAWWSCRVKCTKTTVCEEYEPPKCECETAAPSRRCHCSTCKRTKFRTTTTCVACHRHKKRRLTKRIRTTTAAAEAASMVGNQTELYEIFNTSSGSNNNTTNVIVL